MRQRLRPAHQANYFREVVLSTSLFTSKIDSRISILILLKAARVFSVVAMELRTVLEVKNSSTPKMMLGWIGSLLWQLAPLQATSLNVSSGGGITILTSNTLDGLLSIVESCNYSLTLWIGAQNTGDGAILVNQPVSYNVTSSLCTQLSETIWSHNATKFNAGLDSSISGLVHTGNIREDQLFWVASSPNDGSCPGMDTSGRVQSLDCGILLPVLCTQSAPVSNSSRDHVSHIHNFIILWHFK